jgi:hypothetical protein
MNYRLEWRLIGRADRVLDKGRIDGDFADRAAALETLNALLLAFPFRGSSEAGDYWWGRRSADADIEFRIALLPSMPFVEAEPAPLGRTPHPGAPRPGGGC